MTVEQTWFGVAGMAVFIPIIWYSLKIVEHFAAQEDLSMYRLFDSARGVRAFRTLTIGFTVYALSLLISGYGEMANITFHVSVGLTASGVPRMIGVIANLDRLGAIIAFIALALFLQTVSRITAEDDFDDDYVEQ